MASKLEHAAAADSSSFLEGSPSLNFCPFPTSNESMFDPENTFEIEPLDTESGDELDMEAEGSRSGRPVPPDLDAESLFSAEIAEEGLLTRSQEELLAKRIV